MPDPLLGQVRHGGTPLLKPGVAERSGIPLLIGPRGASLL